MMVREEERRVEITQMRREEEEFPESRSKVGARENGNWFIGISRYRREDGDDDSDGGQYGGEDYPTRMKEVIKDVNSKAILLRQ